MSTRNALVTAAENSRKR